MDDEMIERAARLTRHLPGVERAPHYGRAALKVNGKAFANLCREPGTLAIHCPLDKKAALIEARPDLFFDTDHFSGWPAILVRMDVVDDETLQDRLEAAWIDRAPRKLAKAWSERD